MATEIAGREEELERAGRFLDAPARRPAVLVFEGPAGIGKSTLWRSAVELARERGYVVLASKPAEAERSLPNVVLGDLFGDLPSEVMDVVSGPRRRALDAALLRSEAEEPVDPLALDVAVRTLISRLAQDGTVVIAIDDEQWMDDASRAALRFTLRRLPDTPIRLLLGRRTEGMEADSLERGLDELEVDRVSVGPLSVGALQLLVQARLGMPLGRRALVRVHEATRGNPFYALEVARSIGTSPAVDRSGAPLPVPATLEAAVLERIAGVGSEVTELLLLVAAAGRIGGELGERLALDERLLESAVAARLVERSDGAIVFSHPLLASAVYRRAGDGARRAAHERLAAASRDVVERSRHLALAATGLDPVLAEDLETVAATTWRRGQAFAAAELADHAVRLTPLGASDDRYRRISAAAQAHISAGNAHRARSLIEQLLSLAPAGPRRAEALLVASKLATQSDVVGVLEAALAESGGDPAIDSAIHAAAAREGRLLRGHDWAEEHAESALRLAEQVDSQALRVRALSVLAATRLDRGTNDARELAGQAYDIGRSLGDPPTSLEATISLAHVLAWTADPDAARDVIEREAEHWRDRDDKARAELLWYLALVELWGGRWEVAEACARESLEITEEYGTEAPQQHLPVAMLALHRGDFTTAGAASRRALSLLDERRLPAHQAVLAIRDAWMGDTASALDRFARAEAAADERGMAEPALRWWRPEHAEALVRAGRPADAAALIGPWEATAQRLGRQRLIAQALRVRGLIEQERGDLDVATGLLEEAVAAHAAAMDPFGQARARLALGIVHRRARRKAAAREALGAARRGFEQLGAASWAAATRDELARIGGRRRIHGLSESELRVAELVAAGRTNREIAQALYLGERTVASHLTHVYAKLGIRSRTELARDLLTVDGRESGPEASKVPTS